MTDSTTINPTPAPAPDPTVTPGPSPLDEIAARMADLKDAIAQERALSAAVQSDDSAAAAAATKAAQTHAAHDASKSACNAVIADIEAKLEALK